MRRTLLAMLVVLALGPTGSPGAAAAGDEDNSIVGQVIRGADGSLGADAPSAVARAYDRGYDGVQILEGLIEEGVAPDGTIGADGEAQAPFREPSGVIAGDGTSAEAIALDALERGIQKTTNQLDKQYDLAARAKRSGASAEDVYTMLVVIAATFAGYSPEQIIVDGLMGQGFRLTPNQAGISIVDENGKTIKPDAVEVSEEHEEAEPFIETFVLDALDVVGGVDPRTAAELPAARDFQIDLTITQTGGDTSTTITGRGFVGRAKDKSLRKFWVGSANGAFTGSGACSIGSGGTKHPYTIDGNVGFGISGRGSEGALQLRLAITEANLGVTGDASGCVDLVRDIAQSYEAVSFPSIEVAARNGATGKLQTALGGDPVDIEVKLST